MPSFLIARDHVCQFSEQDRALVEPYRWWLHRTSRNGRYYAYTYVRYTDPEDGRRKRSKLYMHRLITDFPSGYVVDHKDHNGLNNRRSNLRITNNSFNAANAEVCENLSGYRGVTLVGKSRYRARLMHAGCIISLGTYGKAGDAARAYDAKALEVWGEFAWLNFDDEARARAVEEIHEETQAKRELESIPW